MRSRQTDSRSDSTEQERRAMLEEKLAFDAWLESYESSPEAGGGRV